MKSCPWKAQGQAAERACRRGRAARAAIPWRRSASPEQRQHHLCRRSIAARGWLAAAVGACGDANVPAGHLPGRRGTDSQPLVGCQCLPFTIPSTRGRQSSLHTRGVPQFYRSVQVACRAAHSPLVVLWHCCTTSSYSPAADRHWPKAKSPARRVFCPWHACLCKECFWLGQSRPLLPGPQEAAATLIQKSFRRHLLEMDLRQRAFSRFGDEALELIRRWARASRKARAEQFMLARINQQPGIAAHSQVPSQTPLC